MSHSGGHSHNSAFANQNLGNTLGDRSCVRQTMLYRKHESGNTMKELLGMCSDSLKWDVTKKQGAYEGHAVEDHWAVAEREKKLHRRAHRELDRADRSAGYERGESPIGRARPQS